MRVLKFKSGRNPSELVALGPVQSIVKEKINRRIVEGKIYSQVVLG